MSSVDYYKCKNIIVRLTRENKLLLSKREINLKEELYELVDDYYLEDKVISEDEYESLTRYINEH